MNVYIQKVRLKLKSEGFFLIYKVRVMSRNVFSHKTNIIGRGGGVKKKVPDRDLLRGRMQSLF